MSQLLFSLIYSHHLMKLNLHNIHTKMTTLLFEVEEQLVPYIAKFKDADPLHAVDWLYFIDSGGQPQFHKLLSAFIHYTNLNIFVLKLCDKLDDHPNVEYYDEKGICTSSTASLLTNKEILQCCAQATQTTDHDVDSRLLIVCTHRDLEHQCEGESRDYKDKQLIDIFTLSLKGHLLPYKVDEGKLIFPLNAKNPNDDDRNVISETRSSVINMKKRIKPTKIPLRWQVFHEEIQALSKKNRADLLNFEECRHMAMRLHMLDDTEAALMFFSDLNIILYFPSVLPNVVFTNPQTLLNIITEIVKRDIYVGDSSAKEPEFVRACEEGIISLKLLEMMQLQIKTIKI